MWRTFMGVVGGVCGLLLGCSSSNSSPSASLDCAWLAGEKNCWKSLLLNVPSCLPAAGTSGVLSTDGRSCTYATGESIAFDSALVLPVPFDNTPPWSFTVTNGAETCLRYVEGANDSSITLTVNGQTFAETTAGTGLRVTCPDGSVFANSNAFSLLQCGDGGSLFLGGLPGSAWSGSDTSVSFGLIGTSSGEELQVFDCRR